MLANKLMFTMDDREYDTLLDEFDVILKQMDLIGKIENIKLKTVLYNVNLDSLDKVYNKFNKDIIAAMKSKDQLRLTVLRMVKGAMQLDSINNKKEIEKDHYVSIY